MLERYDVKPAAKPRAEQNILGDLRKHKYNKPQLITVKNTQKPNTDGKKSKIASKFEQDPQAYASNNLTATAPWEVQPQ